MMEVRKSGFLRIIPLLITIFSLSYPAYAEYSGGSGTAEDPYQIATAEDLMLLGESPEDYDKHFIMINDIDLDPNLPGRKVFDRAVIAPDIDPDIDPQPGQNPDWEFQGLLFTGVFDGNTHVIRNLFIQGAGYLGLFGQLGSGGKIFNLGLEAVDISGSMEYVGGLVGNNSGSITTCYSSGTVTGNVRVSGLVGANEGSITSCYSVGTVTGDESTGGLVGFNGGSIVASYSISPVSGDHGIGGLVGRNSGGNIIMSYGTGPVSGNEYVGGLVGWNYGSIVASYSTGSVNGKGYVCGLVGQNEGSITTSYSNGTTSGDTKVGGLVGENHGTITTSYSTCMVNGDYAVGGLAGRNSFVGPSTITNCYSAGKVIGNSSVGGLVGDESRSTDVTNCFWDKEIIGFVRGISGKPVTTAEMQTARTFLRAGWDFIDETVNGTEDICWIL